ncbi:hypothetical protein F511_31206 [Dorcoceras hygrometricum]|uniref:X8 domain-containing protein n=1 Tax=Dorcoceras hygrometricum TaxID=472368 RepID=A0A2Z7BTJ1_9LAMI|nr:hypothetical protein F511_31206 [Dorcoceras hygrometricum]
MYTLENLQSGSGLSAPQLWRHIGTRGLSTTASTLPTSSRAAIRRRAWSSGIGILDRGLAISSGVARAPSSGRGVYHLRKRSKTRGISPRESEDDRTFHVYVTRSPKIAESISTLRDFRRDIQKYSPVPDARRAPGPRRGDSSRLNYLATSIGAVRGNSKKKSRCHQRGPGLGPKFMVDLSGQGRDIYPSNGKGVIHMPNRWCVFYGNIDDPRKVEAMGKMACNKSDCSSLDMGGSCSHLDYEKQVSYAFNRYFHTKGQASQTSNDKCDFDGLGKVVPDDPSDGLCSFPVEILSAEHIITEGEMFVIGGAMLHGRISASAVLSALTLLWMIL